MDEIKAKNGFWITQHLWDLYLRRRDSSMPVMRRYALVKKTEALIICDRILVGNSIIDR